MTTFLLQCKSEEIHKDITTTSISKYLYVNYPHFYKKRRIYKSSELED